MFQPMAVEVEDSEPLTGRLDEVEQELIRLLSTRSDDLQLFTSRQDQLLQSHFHSLTAALDTAQIRLINLIKQTCRDYQSLEEFAAEIEERRIERQNLKRFLCYCEEQKRQIISSGNTHSNTTTHVYNSTSNNNANNNNNTDLQTPNGQIRASESMTDLPLN